MQLYYPEDFGAVAGGPDCRVAIQAAMDAAASAGGGCVSLGVGRWHVSRAPAGTYNHFAALSTHSANVELRGEGAKLTTLVASGDAGASTFIVLSLDPGASNVRITDLTIDTSGLVNTDANEQTHALVIGSAVYTPINGTDHMPVENVVVERVRFIHDGAAGERWGDCVRVSGNTPATAARNVRLVGLDFLKSGRSAIELQRNAESVLIQGCYFDADNIGGTAIDGEATGGGWDTGLIVDGCHIVRTLPGGDSFAISMTSQTHFAITNNVLRGRGISLVRGAHGVIANNVIDATYQNTLGTIDIANDVQDVIIAGNTLTRSGGPGPCIKLQPHSGQYPQRIIISNNSVTNLTDGAAVMMLSVSDAVISGNRMSGSGGPNSMGLYLDATLKPVENLVVQGNTFRGMTYAVVRLIGHFDRTAITGCAASACGIGLRQDNFSGTITTGLNAW